MISAKERAMAAFEAVRAERPSPKRRAKPATKRIGRPPGSRNKPKQELIAAAAADGKPPDTHLVDCPRCNGSGKVIATTITIGERFTHARETADLTQIALAAHLSISRSQIANIETNRASPSVEILLAAANLFQVSTDYLLGRKDTP